MKHIYNVKPENQAIDFSLSYITLHDDQAQVPESKDLEGGFPAAFNQGQEGSCTGNGWAGMWDFWELLALRQKAKDLEEYEFLANQYQSASRQFIYYCERDHEGTVGEDSGAMVSTGAWVLQNVGCCSEMVWPYLMTNWSVKPIASAYDEAAKHKIPKAYTLITQSEILHCIASGYPVVCGIQVFEELESQQVAETGILPDPSDPSNVLGGHCIDIAGYDMTKNNGNGMWKVRNSWGTSWGQKGYFWASFDYFANYGMQFMTLRT